jgi:hypothetical protein
MMESTQSSQARDQQLQHMQGLLYRLYELPLRQSWQTITYTESGWKHLTAHCHGTCLTGDPDRFQREEEAELAIKEMLEVLDKLQRTSRPVYRRAWRMHRVQVKEVSCCLRFAMVAIVAIVAV